jgi:hypothetical protein
VFTVASLFTVPALTFSFADNTHIIGRFFRPTTDFDIKMATSTVLSASPVRKAV